MSACVGGGITGRVAAVSGGAAATALALGGATADPGTKIPDGGPEAGGGTVPAAPGGVAVGTNTADGRAGGGTAEDPATAKGD